MNLITNIKPTQEHVLFSDMTTDARLQLRGKCDPETIAEYRRVFQEQDGQFEGKRPVVVRERDNGRTVNWLADGYHRREAGIEEDAKSILCDVYEGGFALARLLAASANQSHGKQRDATTLHACIAAFHEDEAWRTKGVREIGRAVGCRHMTVQRWREKNGMVPETVTYTATTAEGATKEVVRPATQAVGRASNDEDREEKERIPYVVPTPKAKQADDQPAGEREIRDCHGRAVPANLRAIFAEVDEVFDPAEKLLRELSAWVATAKGKKSTIILQFGQLEAEIKNMRSTLRFGKPHSVCDQCDGTGKLAGGKCGCKRGWVGKLMANDGKGD